MNFIADFSSHPAPLRLPMCLRWMLLIGFIAALAAQNQDAHLLIRGQEPPQITMRLMHRVNPSNSWVKVDLSEQRAYLMMDDEIVIDTPISSGKTAGSTPTGNFTVLEKDIDHRSNLYGNFVDSQGRVVRRGVSTRIDSAPSGTHFRGAPMRNFMRLTWGGVGMHAGYLPGYPASHGCIRMPEEIAELIYPNVKIGTKVVVQP